MKVTDVFAIFGGLLVLVGIGYIIYGLIAGKGGGGGGNKPLTLQDIDNETKKRMMLYMNLNFIESDYDGDINCFHHSEIPEPKICNLTVDDKTYQIILSNYKLGYFANYHINSSTDENMLIYLFDKITRPSPPSVYIVDCDGYKCEKYFKRYDPIKNTVYFAAKNVPYG